MKKILAFLFGKKAIKTIAGFLSGTAVGFLISAGIVQPEHRLVIETTIEQAVVTAMEKQRERQLVDKKEETAVPPHVEMIEVE